MTDRADDLHIHQPGRQRREPDRPLEGIYAQILRLTCLADFANAAEHLSASADLAIQELFDLARDGCSRFGCRSSDCLGRVPGKRGGGREGVLCVLRGFFGPIRRVCPAAWAAVRLACEPRLLMSSSWGCRENTVKKLWFRLDAEKVL